jgi:hypothetical protein
MLWKRERKKEGPMAGVMVFVARHHEAFFVAAAAWVVWVMMAH